MSEEFLQRGIEESRDIKKGQKKVVIEIGVGSTPHFDNQVLGKKLFSKDDTYVAFDITQARLEGLKANSSLANETEGSTVGLVRGDALFLPFANESADTIILPDILNATIVTTINKEKDYDTFRYYRKKDFLLSPSKKAVLDNSLQRIVDESVRVLRPGGQLVLIQRYGDENKTSDESPYLKTVKYIEGKLEQQSFEVIPVYHIRLKKTVFKKLEH